MSVVNNCVENEDYLALQIIPSTFTSRRIMCVMIHISATNISILNVWDTVVNLTLFLSRHRTQAAEYKSVSSTVFYVHLYKADRYIYIILSHISKELKPML